MSSELVRYNKPLNQIDEEEAAKAYNKKSVELYGEFAKLNDIKVQQTNP